jgi:hypothetical protein
VSKNSIKPLKIMIAVFLIIIAVAGGMLIYAFIPHTRHFNDIYVLSANKIDGRYRSYARVNGQTFILESDDDLRNVLVDNEDVYGEYDLGPQDIRVKALRFDYYRTDNSGIFMAFPTIAYEYVGS